MSQQSVAKRATSFVKKRRFVFFVAGFILIFILRLYVELYPTYYAKSHTPPGRVFSGHAAWFDPWDLNVYYATIRFGQQNGILLHNDYTSTDNQKVLYYPLYTIAGRLAPHANPITIYQVLVPFAILLLFVVYTYSSYVFTRSYLLTLFILFVTTSIRGLGGLVPLSYNAPDIIYTSFTLRSAFQRPHEGVGMALYTLAMVFLFQFLREGKTRFIVLSLMANLLLTVFYPYYFANYLLTFGVFIIWQKKNIKSHIYVLIATGSVLALATYSYFLNIQHSSFMIAVNEIQPKLTPLQLLIGYGIFLPLVPLSLFLYKKGGVKNTLVFLSIWFTISLALSYVPIGFSRFFLRNMFFPLAVIAVLTVHRLLTRKGAYAKSGGAIAVVIVYLLGMQGLTTLQINTNRIAEVKADNFWFYYPVEYEEAFEVLRSFPKGDVLSPLAVGNLIPAHTNHSVYLGHPIQSPDANARARYVGEFLDNRMREKEAQKFLLKNNIQYVLLDKDGSTATMLKYSFLKNVFENDLAALYIFKQ